MPGIDEVEEWLKNPPPKTPRKKHFEVGRLPKLPRTMHQPATARRAVGLGPLAMSSARWMVCRVFCPPGLPPRMVATYPRLHQEGDGGRNQ